MTNIYREMLRAEEKKTAQQKTDEWRKKRRKNKGKYEQLLHLVYTLLIVAVMVGIPLGAAELFKLWLK